MKPEVEIYDTTLRDGSQGEGINFSVADKLRIAERLDLFGVHYIEGGWPGSNPKDIEFFAQAGAERLKMRVWPRSVPPGEKGGGREDEQVKLLMDAETPVITIYGKSWMLHVKEVLSTTPEENLAMISDTVRYLEGARALRHLRCGACVRWLQGRSGICHRHLAGRGRSRGGLIVLCDTNGGCLPGEIRSITEAAAAKLHGKSASTRTTTSAWAWPMPWRRWKLERCTCKARSMVTANARATAI